MNLLHLAQHLTELGAKSLPGPWIGQGGGYDGTAIRTPAGAWAATCDDDDTAAFIAAARSSDALAASYLRMVEALRPLAAFCDAIDGQQNNAKRDSDTVYRFNDAPITMGMLRAIKAALSDAEGGKGDAP